MIQGQKAAGFAALIMASFMLGCRSHPMRTPSGKFSQTQAKWVTGYKWALSHQESDSAKACALFQSFAADPNFPVKAMAKLRAVETCPPDATTNFDRAQMPPWLQDLSVNVLLKRAAVKGDKTAEIDLAVEKSKQKLTQSEKIKWMNLSIQDADDLHLETVELNQRLYAIAPRLNPAPEENQSLNVASDWRLNRQFDKAREFYEKVLASSVASDDDKIIALKGIRLTYKNARDNKAHLIAAQRLIDFLAGLIKTHPHSLGLLVTSFDAQIYRARAQWTMGQTADAKQTFADLESKMKDRVSLAELYWLQARMADEDKDFTSVAKRLELALNEKINDPDLRDRLMWYSAWNQRRMGDLPQAIARLTELAQTTPTDFTRQRAVFWLGKTQSENHQDVEAKATFLQLLDLDPLGYYGLLAHRQLNLPITWTSPPATATHAVLPPPTTQVFDSQTADWLSWLGEKDALTSLLDLASQNYKRQANQNNDVWVTLFKYYAQAGLYIKLFDSLGNLQPEQRKDILQQHPELLFPRPWGGEVAAAASRFGVSRSLIYAIIRQESAFDPHARSLADAFGLMQLLPEVAEQLSGKYKIPYTGMEDLYDPKTNISLGSAHLNELLRHYNNQFILAVASYNASESVIHSWMKTRFHGDALEFIEDIPYEETRAYVRLVMRNMIFYDLLEAKSGKTQFPADVLKLVGT